MNYKYDRIAAQLKDALNYIINDSNDESLAFITVIEVTVTKDLQDAKVFITTLSPLTDSELIKALNTKQGYFKKQLANHLKIRKIPNLMFQVDHSLDNYNNIENLLKTDNDKN